MKAINQKAQRVMDILTEQPGTFEKSWKFDNAPDVFMAVHVEKLNTIDAGKIFSVSHHYLQSGDVMYDPEMEFLKTKNGEYYPLSFYQSSIGYRREAIIYSIDGRTIDRYDPRLQKELVSFANVWMSNIKAQQKLKAR